MRYRIAGWAIAGVLVAGFWAEYFLQTSHFALRAAVPIQSQPIAFTLARVTCPIAFASFYFNFPIGVYSVLLVNAVTYAMVGLIVETLRHHLHHG
jgi:hypothetical protein